MKTPLLLVKTLLSLMLFSIITTSSIAQNWQQIYFEDFNAHTRIPREFAVQNFSSSLIGYGASGANDDKCASSPFLTYGTYIAYKALLEDGVTYRFGWNLKTKEPGRKIQYMYGSALSLASATHSGSSMGIPVLGLTGPGEDIYSEEIEGTGDVVFLIAAVPSRGNDGTTRYNVHFDNFTIEKLNVSYLNFDVASIEIEEGGSTEVCISLSDHASNAFDVELAFEGGQSPHFTSTQPISLSFNEGDTQQCFTLQTEPDNGVEDDILNYVLNILPPDAGTGGELGDVTTLQIQVLEGDGCPYAGMDRTICEGECVILGCEPEADTENYCYKWEPMTGMEEGQEFLAQPEVCPERTTTYTVYITDDEGHFIDQDEVTITVQNIELSIYPNGPYVCPDSTETLEAVTSGVANYNYNWSTGETTSIIEIDAVGMYAVTVTNEDTGCSENIQTNVVEYENAVNVYIEQNAPSVCEGVSVSLVASPGVPDGEYSYEWSTYESGTSITVEEEGVYTITLTDESSGCSSTATVNITNADYTIEIEQDAYLICDGEPVEMSVPEGYSNYEWSGPEGFARAGSDVHTIAAENAGTYYVTVTDDDGCEASTEAEVGDPLEPDALRAYFEERGFYSIPITIIGPADPVREGMRGPTICDEEACPPTGSACVRDDARLLINMEGDDIPDLKASIESHLMYFEEEFGYANTKAFITSNENVCACPEYLNFIEEKFNQEESTGAFWIHLFEGGYGEDEFLILSKMKHADAYYPGGDANRERLISGTLRHVNENTETGNFTSKGEQNIFVAVDALLDNHLGVNQFNDENELAQSQQDICENVVKEDVVGVAPSGIPIQLPSKTILRFGVQGLWSPYTPNGALTGFTDVSDEYLYKYYNARLNMNFPSQIGAFEGYYRVDIKGNFISQAIASPYESPDPFIPSKVTLGEKLQDQTTGQLYYQISTWPFECDDLVTNLSGAGSVYQEDFLSATANWNCLGVVPIDETQPYNIDLPSITEAELDNASSNALYGWNDGVLITIPRANGYVDYIYAQLTINGFIYYQWSCATGQWVPYTPGDQGEINQIGFEYTNGENNADESGSDGEGGGSGELDEPECFEIAAGQIDNDFDAINFDVNADPNGTDIQDYAGISPEEKNKIQEAINTGRTRWGVEIKYILSADSPQNLDIPVDNTNDAHSSYHDFDMSGTDVLFWMHYRSDGSAAFCMKFNEDYFETDNPMVNADPEFAAEQLEAKSVMLDAIRKSIGATEESLRDNNTSDDGPLEGDVPIIPDEKPWRFGLREEHNEEVNFYTVSKELLGIGKVTMKKLEVPDKVWKRDGDCMFDGAGPIIQPVNVIVSENPIVGAAQLVSLGVSCIEDQQTRDAMGQMARHPVKVANGYFKQKYEAYTGVEGLEVKYATMSGDGASIIMAILTGSGVGKIKDFIESLSPNAQDVTQSMKRKLDDFPGDVRNEFYDEIGDFDEVVSRDFAEFMGKVGEDHVTKFITNPKLARIWKKFKDDGIDLDGLDIHNTLKRFPEDNPAFYDKLFDTFVDADGVVMDRVQNFFDDLQNNNNLLNEFVQTPIGIKGWDLIVEGISTTSNFRKDIPTIRKVGEIITENSGLRNKFPDSWENEMREILQGNSGLRCDACTGVGYPPYVKMPDFLDDVNYFLNNFNVASGELGVTFYGWIKNQTGNPGQRAEMFQTVLYLKNKGYVGTGNGPNSVQSFGSQFPSTPNGINAKKYDIKRFGETFTELKNRDFSGSPLGSSGTILNSSWQDIYEQLVYGYFYNVRSIDKLAWVADIRRFPSGTTSQVGTQIMREKWQAVFQLKKNEIIDSMSDGLKESLDLIDPNTISSRFDQLANDINSDLYSFIKAE